MYLDVKYSAWKRLYLNENATKNGIISVLEENQKLVKLGLIPTKVEEMISKSDVLYETEMILPSEAEEDATIELYDNEQKCIWKNI